MVSSGIKIDARIALNSCSSAFCCIPSHFQLDENTNVHTRPSALVYRVFNTVIQHLEFHLKIVFFFGRNSTLKVAAIIIIYFSRMHCRKQLLQWRSTGTETTETSQRKETKEGEERFEKGRRRWSGCQRCQIEWKRQRKGFCWSGRCRQSRIKADSISGEPKQFSFVLDFLFLSVLFLPNYNSSLLLFFYF